MITGYTFGVIKLLGTFALLLGFCAWQLYYLRRDRLRAEREAAARSRPDLAGHTNDPPASTAGGAAS